MMLWWILGEALTLTYLLAEGATLTCLLAVVVVSILILGGAVIL